MKHLSFRAIRDEGDGPLLRARLIECWPAYQRWMRRAPACPLAICVAELRAHMPELVPTFERLLAMCGGRDDVARFLTLYQPPRVVGGCSQVVIDDDGPVLIRSYDHHPRLFDGTVLASAWNGASTLAVGDCVWGALDGVNTRGLAVALAFGGRNVVGPGFAAPLVTRYLLETCATVAEARATLTRLPVYMSYIFVIADATGEFVTAFISPDRAARFVTRRASANHLSPEEWPAYCRHTESVERLCQLESLLGGPITASQAVETFLRPPLWRTQYERGSGTLYVVEYRPASGAMSMHWPGQSQSFKLDAFEPRSFSVDLSARQPDLGEVK